MKNQDQAQIKTQSKTEHNNFLQFIQNHKKQQIPTNRSTSLPTKHQSKTNGMSLTRKEVSERNEEQETEAEETQDQTEEQEEQETEEENLDQASQTTSEDDRDDVLTKMASIELEQKFKDQLQKFRLNDLLPQVQECSIAPKVANTTPLQKTSNEDSDSIFINRTILATAALFHIPYSDKHELILSNIRAIYKKRLQLREANKDESKLFQGNLSVRYWKVRFNSPEGSYIPPSFQFGFDYQEPITPAIAFLPGQDANAEGGYRADQSVKNAGTEGYRVASSNPNFGLDKEKTEISQMCVGACIDIELLDKTDIGDFKIVCLLPTKDGKHESVIDGNKQFINSSRAQVLIKYDQFDFPKDFQKQVIVSLVGLKSKIENVQFRITSLFIETPKDLITVQSKMAILAGLNLLIDSNLSQCVKISNESGNPATEIIKLYLKKIRSKAQKEYGQGAKNYIAISQSLEDAVRQIDTKDKGEQQRDIIRDLVNRFIWEKQKMLSKNKNDK